MRLLFDGSGTFSGMPDVLESLFLFGIGETYLAQMRTFSEARTLESHTHSSATKNFLTLLMLCLGCISPVLSQDYEATQVRGSKTVEMLGVAFLAPFSGPDRAFGEAAREGFELALARADLRQIKVFFHDHAGDPVSALRGLRDLRREHQIHVVVCIGDRPGNLLAPIVQNLELPFFSWSDISEVSQRREFVFGTAVQGVDEGKVLAREAIRRGYKRIAIAYTDTRHYKAIAEGFRKAMGSKSTVFVEPFPPGTEPNFGPFLRSAKARRVTAIGLFLEPGLPSQVAMTAGEQRLIFDFFGVDSLYSNEELRRSQDTLLGAWFVAPKLTDEFFRLYSRRFGEGPALRVAGIHHDLALLLAKYAIAPYSAKAFVEKLARAELHEGAFPLLTIEKVGSSQKFSIPLTVLRSTVNGFQPLDYMSEAE